jgi:hypothetical protein
MLEIRKDEFRKKGHQKKIPSDPMNEEPTRKERQRKIVSLKNTEWRYLEAVTPQVTQCWRRRLVEESMR